MTNKTKRIQLSQNISFLFAGLMLLVPAAVESNDRFQGPYAGTYLGYVDGKDSVKEYYDDPPYNGGPDGGSYKNALSGTIYGLLGGYNVRYGKDFVYGVEADYEGRSANKTSPVLPIVIYSHNYPLETELKEATSIRARLGYLLNGGQTLVYVTAGYAVAKITRTYGDLATPGGPYYSAITSWQEGWTAGAGFEHFIGNQFSFRAEYRYSDYGMVGVDVPVFGPAYHEHQRYDDHTYRVGAVYHF